MLATLFTSFLSIKLVRLADRTEERVLPVPISFILDEFPNIGVVPDFKKKLATARSRRIGMSILFQNIPQLQNRYPDNQWEEIIGRRKKLFRICVNLFCPASRTAMIRDNTTSSGTHTPKNRSVLPAARRNALFANIVL